MCPKNGSSLDLDPDPMDLMDLRLTGFGSRSNPSISYTAPEQISQWPKLNYINPETRVGIVFWSCLSTMVLMIVLILARFYARAKMKSFLGPDDWTMGVAAVSTRLLWLSQKYRHTQSFLLLRYHCSAR